MTFQLLLVFSVAVAVTVGQDECIDGVAAIGTCAGEAIQDKLASMTEADWSDKKDTMDQCFVDAGCDKPVYDADIFDDLPKPWGDIMKGFWDKIETLDPEVKTCLRDQMANKMRDMAKKCLEVDDLPELPVENFKSMMPDKDPQMEKDFKVMVLNVGRAVRKCGDKMPTVMDCLEKIMEEKYQQLCELKKECVNKNPLTDDCMDKIKGMKGKLCQCAADKKKEFETKMDEMQEKMSGKSPMEVMKALKGSDEGDKFKKEVLKMLGACGISKDEMFGEMKQKLKDYFSDQPCMTNAPPPLPDQLKLMKCIKDQFSDGQTQEGMMEIGMRVKDYFKSMGAGKEPYWCKCKMEGE